MHTFLWQDASISSLDSEVDLGELLGAMDDALKEQNMAKVTEVKALIEQGMEVFFILFFIFFFAVCIVKKKIRKIAVRRST